MDVQLRGEMDGIEAAHLIRRRFDIPVIYLTAYSDDATLRRAQITEPYGYLLKPFEERELSVVIEMALFRHRAQKEHERLLSEQAARAAIEKEHRWLQFLAEAGSRLSASLDLDQTLSAVAKLTVPQLADLTSVHLKEGDVVRTVEVCHAGGKEEVVRELLHRYPPDSTFPHGYARVISTGQPELWPSVGKEALTAAAVDGEHLRLLLEVGLEAQICVPLISRGEVLGAMTLAMAGSNRRYGREDLDRAMELARRCASAIDNARLYQKAQQAIVAREEFLSVASHELRTPLASMMLGLENVERAVRRLGAEPLGAKFERLMQQFENLSELIDRLLDVSRLSAGKLDLTPEELDLAALVREVLSRFEDSARQVGAALQVRAPGELKGRWDRMRVEQVVTNLVGNALKFCAGKPVEVTLEGEAEQVRLVVRDHGIGIPKLKLPLIFDRFERGVSPRHYGGLGLGLYVVRQLVEAHGGRISVESEAGQGTTFFVDLPRHVAAREPAR